MYSWNIVMILVASMLIALLLVVILVLGLRWFKYRERMAAIQRTAAVPELFADDAPEQRRRRQLAYGLTTALVGLALTIGLGTLGIGPWLLVGLIPFFVGLSMILTYLITQPEKPEKEIEALPVKEEPEAAASTTPTAESQPGEPLVVEDSEEDKGDEEKEDEPDFNDVPF